jgi:DNA-directed RNA polymerase subunit beta'
MAEDGSHIVVVRREDTEVWEVELPANARLRVDKGAEVEGWRHQLTEGAKNPKEILRIQGREACQLYLLEEVQRSIAARVWHSRQAHRSGLAPVAAPGDGACHWRHRSAAR